MLSEDRKGRVTASEVGAILGLSPYRTAEDVMRSMVREWFGAEKEFTGNAATEWGQAHEADAIAQYSVRSGATVRPGTFYAHPEHNWLGATPDGISSLGDVIEVKCPFNGKMFDLKEKPFYWAQVQIQMQCAGPISAVFGVYIPPRMGADGSVIPPELHDEPVARDDEWFQSVLPELKAFHDEFLAIIDDFELSSDYLAPKEREMDSDEWRDAAESYRLHQMAFDEAKADLDEAKGTLIRLAEGRKSRGAGVVVYPIAGRKTVDYKSAVTDLCQGADLEKYSKVGKPTWGVKEYGE